MAIPPHNLAVWAAEQRAGLLGRSTGQGNYVFAYDQTTAQPDSQVSLTMPVRLESWSSRDLHPVFQMNLPEGALLEAVRRAIAKVVGDDDMSILRVTGGNQVGRNRFALPEDSAPGIMETRESLEDLLAYPDTEELFHELLSRYALRSGVSGVQPKVMLAATERGTAAVGGYIVKSWGSDYPQLAANEYFCMTAARLAGLPVPDFHLSENGGLFVMKRFDIAANGKPIGFEDFCSLQGVGASRKYGSTYEKVAGSIRDFVSPEFRQEARRQFFTTLVLSSIVQNGDAHLKNFGVIYERPGAPVHLAPVYDVVTTTAYIAKDIPALSLAGTKKWWPRKMLEQFAVAHLALSIREIEQIIEKTAGGVAGAREMLAVYTRDHREFREVGKSMQAAWESGLGLVTGR